MPLIEPIKIEGIRDFQRALKNMDGESQKKLRLVWNEAADTVARGASRRVPVVTGAARKSLKAGSSQREARVKGGGRRAPYYGWLDFGGTAGRGQRRRFIQGGRYVYPAFAANRDAIFEHLSEALSDLAQEAGLEVSE